MIFKYHSFEILPWGAVLNVRGKSSTKEINTVINYSTTTSYTTAKEALGKNRSFFVESKKEPVRITYTVNSKNGDLVEIQTNLSCTTSKNSSGIITEFTLDNTNWFNTSCSTEDITIQKIIQTTYLTITKDLHGSINFYNGNIGIQQSFSSGKNYYFNSLDAPNGTTIKASYNYLQEITETKIATGTSVIWQVVPTHQVVSTIEIYNVTKGKTISNYSYNSSYNNYYYYGYLSYSQVSIGDTVRIKYKYAIPYEENLIVKEYKENTLHRGTISNNNKDRPIEDCMDKKGYYVLYTRDKSYPQYIYLKTDIYDNIQNGITVRFEKEKPYVKLCCNNVKVETILRDSANNWSCDFEKLDTDSNYIYPKAVTNYNSKSKFSRYAKISWNKSETQQLYFGEEGTGGLFWGISGGSSEGYNLLAYTENHSTNNLTVTIPPIKNFSQPYYYVACTVNIKSCSWYGGFDRYINTNFTNYTENGYLKVVNNTSKLNINCDSYNIPEINSLDKWGDNKSFYKSGDYYLNPSDGLELKTDWYCDGYVPCGECGECGECGQGGGTKYAVVKGSGASGYEIWPPSGSPKYWVPGGTETLASNYSSLSGGGYYFTWTASWGELVSAWVYSDNVDIVER